MKKKTFSYVLSGLGGGGGGLKALADAKGRRKPPVTEVPVVADTFKRISIFYLLLDISEWSKTFDLDQSQFNNKNYLHA